MTEEEFRARIVPLRRLMYAFALRLGISEDDASDAVQETLIRLWRHRDAIPVKPNELKLYCMASMRNECLTRLSQRRNCEPLENLQINDSQNWNEVEFVDTKRRIEALIERLPAGQRVAIRLSAFAQLDNIEIARQMGQSENNVRQLLSRGRRRLRELMGKME